MKALIYDKFYILVKTVSHIFSKGYFKKCKYDIYRRRRAWVNKKAEGNY